MPNSLAWNRSICRRGGAEGGRGAWQLRSMPGTSKSSDEKIWACSETIERKHSPSSIARSRIAPSGPWSWAPRPWSCDVDSPPRSCLACGSRRWSDRDTCRPRCQKAPEYGLMGKCYSWRMSCWLRVVERWRPEQGLSWSGWRMIGRCDERAWERVLRLVDDKNHGEKMKSQLRSVSFMM